MTQKLNNDQLRQLYFDNSTPSKTFRKHKQHFNTSQSEQSFFDTHIKYGRFSELEINRFENFFNTYVYPTHQDYIFKSKKIIPTSSTNFENKDSYFSSEYHKPSFHLEHEEKEADVIEMTAEIEIPQTSQLEKDLIKQVKADEKCQNDVQAEIVDEVNSIESIEFIKESSLQSHEDVVSNENIEVENDDADLIYLENLVTNGASGIATPSPNSLSEIFTEIVDNEKESISNYESSLFDANIQLLFDEAPEIEMLNLNIEVPTIPLEIPLIEDESVKNITKNPENIKTPKTISKKHTKDDAKNIALGKKKKKSKLNIIDTVLVLMILIIIVIFLFNSRHLLPFDVPF